MQSSRFWRSLGAVGLWWRLASGPIQLDVVTPWLAAAIEENFGSGHHVEVGGTQIEHTENGGTAVRIRDIVVRDADGAVVASAPKAEVRVSGLSLLRGHIRAESLNLVGAEMAVRIEQDGGVTDLRRRRQTSDRDRSGPAPLPPQCRGPAANEQERMVQAAASTASHAAAAPGPSSRPRSAAAASGARRCFAAHTVAGIDGIGETGLDGHDLRELGLKNGNLTVDDDAHRQALDVSGHQPERRAAARRRRRGHHRLGQSERPWGLTASIMPTRQGYRRIELEARRVAASDLLLASRFGDGNCADRHAALGEHCRPDRSRRRAADIVVGRIVVEAGSIGGANEEDGRLAYRSR